jgi:3-oxoadipate CoA-transferase, beta subunit
LHSENGILGIGAAATGQDIDPDLINASRILITLIPGASISEHTISFAVMRGGHLDYTVLGGFQVADNGDLAVGAKHVFVTMEHLTRDGQPKILNACTYPLTSAKVVDQIYTDIVVIDVGEQGLRVRVRALLDGVSFELLQSLTEAPLKPASTLQRIVCDSDTDQAHYVPA